MSFLPINEQNQQAPTGQTTNAPQGTGTPPPQQSGGSVGGGTSGGAKGGPNSGSPAQFGSSASKLGDYLSANAPQVTQEANNLAGNLNNQYAGLNTEINNGANAFNQQVQGGYAAADPNLVNQAVTNTTQFAQDPNNVSGFQAQYNDQYTGPQSFESTTPYSTIQGDVSNAVSQAGLLNNQAGLTSYLQGMNPNSTQATSTLDALLLNGNPGAQQTLQNAAGQFGNLTGNLQNAVTTGDAGVTAAQQAAAAAQQQAQIAFNPVAANSNAAIQQELQNAQTGVTNYNKNIDQTQQNATALGQILASGPQTWGSVPNYSLSDWAQNLGNPLSQYTNLNPVSQTPTAANVASSQDYAQQAAIQQLLGGGFTPTLDQSNIGQAGTFNLPTNGATPQQLTASLGDWLKNTEMPQYQAANQNLNNIGRDVAFAGASQQAAKQQQFVDALKAADPQLAAYLGA